MGNVLGDITSEFGYFANQACGHAKMKLKNKKKTTARHGKTDLSLRKLRSAISNGSQVVLGNCDHRSASLRRLRDLVNDAISDLGGADMLSSAEMILVRKSAMLALQTEMMESNWARDNGGEASTKQIETYQRTVNTLRRVLESLGLERRAKDVTGLSLGDILSAGHRHS